LKPDYGGAHLNLAAVYHDLERHNAALHHGREAVRLLPKHEEAWFTLGLILLDHVLLEDAVLAFRKAVGSRPTHAAAVGALLYTLNLLPGISQAEITLEHRKAARGLFGKRPENLGYLPSTPVRIGYVSGDFKAHAISYFFEPILQRHDPTRFETYCYSDVKSPDAVTKRLKTFCQHWRDTANWSDEELHRHIRADKIDILVDLVGYTAKNRLNVFAKLAAPRQITYLGYPTTTGMEAMHFRIVDNYTAPVSEEFTGTEHALRLPKVFACFRPPPDAPRLTPGPAAANDGITFGSFHKLEKINHEVIQTWSQLLQQTPRSRLLLMRDKLDDWQQQRILLQFAKHGVSADRLEMRKFDKRRGSFLDSYSDIDIQLDTFPWSGHTMACMALWMGVPVITLSGYGHAGRMVASVLNTVGLGDLIACDCDSYVRIGTELATNGERLQTLRMSLRDQVKSSPLCDEVAFTQAYEDALLAAHT
jgi:predicted O-linked N-acetylglucosamine transferase (SPINDLY family)